MAFVDLIATCLVLAVIVVVARTYFGPGDD